MGRKTSWPLRTGAQTLTAATLPPHAEARQGERHTQRERETGVHAPPDLQPVHGAQPTSAGLQSLSFTHARTHARTRAPQQSKMTDTQGNPTTRSRRSSQPHAPRATSQIKTRKKKYPHASTRPTSLPIHHPAPPHPPHPPHHRTTAPTFIQTLTPHFTSPARTFPCRHRPTCATSSLFSPAKC